MRLPRFNRKYQVSFGNLDVSQLDVEFDIKKGVGRSPNTAVIKIFNLNAESRAKAAASKEETLVFRAGYESDGPTPPTLFSGDIRRAWSYPNDSDVGWVTEIHGKDGGTAFSRERINKSYGPGVALSQILNDIVKSMGIGVGNLRDFVEEPLYGGLQKFDEGFVAYGPAHRVLTGLLRGADLRWSVQNGSLQILRRGRPLTTRLTRIAADTGMIGSPSKNKKGVVSVAASLQPNLDPGRRVYLESAEIDGDFKIRKVHYEGYTRGDAWHASLEMKAFTL